MSDRKTIGILIGAGALVAGGIGAAAAVAHARSTSEDPLATGIIPGYGTYPGEPYSVYVEVEGENVMVDQAVGIWFEEVWDNYKFLYDKLRQLGLPPAGVLVAMGHSHKAGLHSTGKRTPLRGWNFWGVVGGKAYRKEGAPYYIAESGMKYRFYLTPNQAIEHWLTIMRKFYPIAYAELFKKSPDPYAYEYGLFHGVEGRQYAPGVEDFPEVIIQTMETVPELLHEHFGYNFNF